MNVGIDKLQLYFGLDRFIVKDMNLFDQTIIKKKGQQPEVWAKDRQGNEIAGNLYVNPDRKTVEIVGLAMNRKGLSITLNPSKLFHSWHLLEVEHLDQTLDVVHDSLNRHGIVLAQNLTDAAISRIDLTKQAQTSLPAGMYGSVLMSTVHAKRVKNTSMYPDGYTTGNKTRSVTLYDKTAERKLNGITDVPSNLTRLEARYRGKASISNTKNNGLGLGTFDDALNAKTSYLNEKYNSYLREDIFRVQPNGIQMDLPFEIGNHYALIEVMFDQAENEAKEASENTKQKFKELSDKAKSSSTDSVKSKSNTMPTSDEAIEDIALEGRVKNIQQGVEQEIQDIKNDVRKDVERRWWQLFE